MLEFDLVRKELLDLAYTQGGREMVSLMSPSPRIDEVMALQRETAQAKAFILNYGSVALVDVKPIGELLKLCMLGAQIQPQNLLDLHATLKAARSIKQTLEASKVLAPDIWLIAQKIRPQPEIEQIISKTIDEHGEVLDSASDRLASIRVQMRIVHTRVQSKLNEIIKTPSYARMIQEPIITIRDDRFVIPLKGEYKNHFPCIVHDSSASGQTLYVEPLSVIPLNNDLRNLRFREREEIEQIMAEIAREIAYKAPDLEILDEALSMLDFIFARAQLALRWDCSQPEVVPEPKLDIISGKHPLLNVDPVPIDIRLGDTFRVIVLTGPNTGGKTVTLKTVGLFVAMTQCGLQVPAKEGTLIGMFDDILVDIGDEQSMSQNLSTFSAHIANISSILAQATRTKLVLLDELGAGTDPSEGAALAYAITDHLYKIGCLAIITTHIGELKNFAYRNPQTVNAAVGFDPETLRPTYRIHLGTPGASHAFEVALRIGLQPQIIEKAKGLMKPEEKSSADIISRMADDAKTIMEERELAIKAKVEAEELLHLREVELEELKTSKQKMLERELGKAKKFFNEKLEEADEIVKKLAKATRQSKETDQLHKRLQDLQTELTQQTNEPQEVKTMPTEIDGIKSGDVVYVPRFKSQGVVMDVYPDKGKLLVQVGTARVQLPANTVELVVEPVEEPLVKKKEARPIFDTVPLKLELFGMPIEDALIRLERYLDSAFGAGMPFVYIVHGRGSGALRKAIQDYLPQNQRVDRFQLAQPNEGGDAVTIVFLK